MAIPLQSFFRMLIGAALLTSFKEVPQQTESTAEKQAETELLSLHMEERRAHFNHDVEALLAHVAPQLLDVRDGREIG